MDNAAGPQLLNVWYIWYVFVISAEDGTGTGVGVGEGVGVRVTGEFSCENVRPGLLVSVSPRRGESIFPDREKTTSAVTISGTIMYTRGIAGLLYQTVITLCGIFVAFLLPMGRVSFGTVPETAHGYWLELLRGPDVEILYWGLPGDPVNSFVQRIFPVKSGMPGKRPTPLPQLLGRPHWNIVSKQASTDDVTAPFFLTLDVPVTDGPPYGPDPYIECGGVCNWELPGNFGLHGINGDRSRLSASDPGSSGCIRHADSDIRYLYRTLPVPERTVPYFVRGSDPFFTVIK